LRTSLQHRNSFVDFADRLADGDVPPMEKVGSSKVTDVS